MSNFKQAVLFNGEVLTFPAETSDSVIDSAVKRETMERRKASGDLPYSVIDEQLMPWAKKTASSAARGTLDAAKEVFTDPVNSLRGTAGMAGDLAAGVAGGALGIVKGGKAGLVDRAGLSGTWDTFKKTMEETTKNWSPSQYLDQDKLKNSKSYQYLSGLVEAGDKVAESIGPGWGNIADVVGDVGRGKNPGLRTAPSPLAQEIGSAAQIATGLGLLAGSFTHNRAGRVTSSDADGFVGPPRPPEQFGPPKPANWQPPPPPPRAPWDPTPNDFLNQPELFPETLSSQIPTIDPAKMRPIEEFPFGGRSELGVQRDLFDNPVRPVDSGLVNEPRRAGDPLTPTPIQAGDFPQRNPDGSLPIERTLTSDERLSQEWQRMNETQFDQTGPNGLARTQPGQSNWTEGSLDFWASRLEDQNLIYDKAEKDGYTRRDLDTIEKTLTEINELDKVRKQALVDLSDPNQSSSLEGDKVFRFQQINDAQEAKIRPLVDKLNETWGKLQTRMQKREDAPKTRQVYPNDPNAPARATGPLTPVKTETPDLGTRDPSVLVNSLKYSESAALEGDLGQGLSLEPKTPNPLDFNVSRENGGQGVASWTLTRLNDLLGRFGSFSDESSTRAWATFMSPGDFLNLTADKIDLQRIANESRPLDKADLRFEQEPIYLYVTRTSANGATEYQVLGHQGRHRMLALHLAGVKKIPIVVEFDQASARSAPSTGMYFLRQEWPGTGGMAHKDVFNRQGAIAINFKNAKDLQRRFVYNQSELSFTKGTTANSLPATKATKLQEQLERSVVAGDLNQGLTSILELGMFWEKVIAKLLLANIDRVKGLKVNSFDRITDDQKGRVMEGWRAFYDSRDFSVNFGAFNGRDLSSDFLHEVVHAFSASVLNQAIEGARGLPGTRMFAANQFVKLYDDVAKRHPELVKDFPHSMRNAKEFLSETFSNPEFRDRLKKIFVTGVDGKTKIPAWKQFIYDVADLLGIPHKDRTQMNALTRAMDLGTRIIGSGNAKDNGSLSVTTKTVVDPTMGRNINSNEKRATYLAQAAAEFKMDKRPLAQVLTESGITPENISSQINDIGTWGIAGAKGLVDRALSVTTQGRGFVHDVIKNIVDRQQAIERAKADGVESFGIGANWVTGKWGIVERTPAGGLLTTIKASKLPIKDAIQMKETWLQNVGNDSPLSRGDFSNQAQWDAYSTMQNNLRKMWDQTNEARQKVGEKPIPFINNYFPSQWEGDYRVFIRDPFNKLIDVRSAHTRKEAAQIAAALTKDFADNGRPNWSVTPGPASKGVAGIANLGIMDDIMSALHNHPTEFRAAQRAYARVAGKRGFGSTALQRKGVAGAMGYEEGKPGLDKMMRSLEIYVNRQQTYIANIERQLLKNELADLPKEVQAKMGNTLGMLHNYLDQAKGSLEIHALDRGMRWLGDAFGYGDQAVHRQIQRGSAIASMFYLFTWQFFLANPLQVIGTIPKVMQLKQLGNTTASTPVTLFNGFNNYIKAITPGTKDPGVVLAYNWARKNGYIVPAIAKIMNEHFENHARTSTSIPGKTLDWAQAGFGRMGGLVEEWGVRAPAFFVYEQALRSTVKDPETRFREAASMTDYYMVHYSQEALPAFYKEIGETPGAMAKPLKMFSHNYYDQFLEYFAHVVKAGDVKSAYPVIAFVMGGMMVGGAANTVGQEFIDLIIAAVNAIKRVGGGAPMDQLPSTKDFIASTDWTGSKFGNDLATYGIPSAVTGGNLAGSVQAPQLTSLMQFPIVSFWGGIAMEAMEFTKKAASGLATPADEMRLLTATSPLILRPVIENLYSKDGVVPNPKDSMRPMYRRDEAEQFWTTYTGVRSTDEARYRQLVSSAKMFALTQREKRMQIMDKIYADVLEGNGPNPELVQKYQQVGGDGRLLVQNIRQRMKTQDSTWAERPFQRDATPASVMDRQSVQRLLGEQSMGQQPQ